MTVTTFVHAFFAAMFGALVLDVALIRTVDWWEGPADDDG